MYVQALFLMFVLLMEKCESKYCVCLYYSANAFARIMTKMADEAFASTGLSSSYAFLLMTVNDKPGIQPKEISQQLQLTPSTITRFIEKMEHRGLLERKHSGRITEVYPTKASLKLNKQIQDAWMNLSDISSKTFGKEEVIKLTEDINSALRKSE